MGVGELLNKDEEARLVRAIATAEARSSGEIRLHIAKKSSRAGALADAARVFEKLGMTQTRHRNGVMIFIAVKNHEIAILGDKGINEKLGQQGWQRHVDQLLAHFRKGDFFVGLKQVIEEIGEELHAHFPHEEGLVNPNELPNEISRH